MDFRQLEYFIEIAKENNVTKAAEHLFISQSALNQYLLKLEKELGTQLFVRAPRNWRLTPAGEIYLEGCRQAMAVRTDTYNHIQDVTESQSSTLRIGLTPIRGLEMFTAIFPELHREFPSLKIMPTEMDARTQQKAVSAGDIDLGFLILPEALSDHNSYIDLGEEEIILLVPRDHPLIAGYHESSTIKQADNIHLPEISLDRLFGTPFALTQKGSTFRNICDQIFENYGMQPDILMETSTTFHIAQLTETGQCCGLIPYYYARKDSPFYRCFALTDHPVWHLYIVYRKGSYLTRASQAFIEAAKTHWSRQQLIP